MTCQILLNLFIKRIKTILEENGCTEIQTSCQFNYFYGVLKTPSGQIYYFSCADVRYFKYEMMYRTAKSYSDWTDGCNEYTPVEKLDNAIKKITAI